MRASARAGFTLIEALFALSLLALIVVKLTLVIDTASDASSAESGAMTLEDNARHVLDKIAFEVMCADRDALFPDPESPNFSTAVEFQMSLGIEDGEIVWADPEWIGLSEKGNQVVWKQNAGLADELRVSWSNAVRTFYEEEQENGSDDNGNGLADEAGLSFTLVGDAVVIRLCLERIRSNGETFMQSVETVVTLRN